MTAIVIPYADHHFEALSALWEAAFPDDRPHNRAALAVPEKVAFQRDLFLMAEIDGAVVGSIMAGYDGYRGWLYAVAVAGTHRRQGIGEMLVREAEARLVALGCRKINLQVRERNAAVAAFYASMGYAIEPVFGMGKLVAGADGSAGR